jgi:chemotaxis protein MotB
MLLFRKGERLMSTLWLKSFLLVSVFAVFAAGCVALPEYDKMKEEMRFKDKSIMAGDRAVAQREQRLKLVEAELKAKEHENQLLKEKLVVANEALNRAKESMDSEYGRLVEELRKSGNFEIDEESGGIVLDGSVFFDSGRHTLRKQGKFLLDKLVAVMCSSEYNGFTIEVAGHTDSDPIKHSRYKDNWQLSAERAREVLRYVISKGISAKRAFLSGYADTRPRGSKKESRRVEVVLHKVVTDK